MTHDIVIVEPGQTIEDCMQFMTQERIRHLPVIDHQHLIGLISIGDVVKALITSKELTIDNLENFIEGRGYGQ